MTYHLHQPFLSRVTLFLTLLIVGTAMALAEDKLSFSVVDFHNDPFDYSANDPGTAKTDGNGDKFAIIKVMSNNPKDNLNEYSFNFGNMRHTVEDHDGVLWLYVQKNAKQVTISRPGYATLNKHDLHTTIESGKNYVMFLSSEDKKVLTQMVRFNIKPARSKAFVSVKNSYIANAQEEVIGTADENGSVAKNLEYGTYTYRVMAPNYQTSDGSFTLNDSKTTHVETVELQSNYSVITLTVDSDADIYVNNEKMGTRYWQGNLSAGNYQVECRKKNHQSTYRYVQVVKDENQTIALKAPTPIMGTVSITSNPLGADIKIDGEPYGQTPKLIDIVIGSHRLELTKDGFSRTVQTFEVAEKVTAEVEANMGRNTHLDILSLPLGAKLYIDGEFKGETPQSFDGEVGKHKVTLTLKGYDSVTNKTYFGDVSQVLYTLHKQYIRWHDFYIDLGLNCGKTTGLAVAMGSHLGLFNIEANFCYSAKKSPEITQTYSGYYGYNNTQACTYQPKVNAGGKIGYGIKLCTRARLTPQVGFRFTHLAESSSDGYSSWYNESVNGWSGTVGARAYVALFHACGISITPEYLFPIVKNDKYKSLSEVSPEFDNFIKGFNLKIALSITL
jgi:hypothetical protein